MFNELLSKLGRERDMPFSEPESQTKGLQSLLAGLGNNQPSEPAAERGLGGWLKQAQQQGGFFERLGTFGAELQDTADGGRRGASRREQLQTRDTNQTAQAARLRLNELAGQIITDPRERLLFQADPDGWAKANESRFSAYNLGEGENRMIGDNVLASRPAAPTTYNTSRGVYQVNGDQGEFLEEFEPDPLEQELLRAQIEATKASGRQRDASAARSARPPAARGGSRPAAVRAPVNAAAVRWD